MQYCDIVRTEEIEPAAAMAKKLGWSSLCFVRPWTSLKDIEAFKGTAQKIKGAGTSTGIEISTQKPHEIKHIVQSARKSVELIIASGASVEANRLIVETGGIDILKTQSLDYITARLAKKNSVAIMLSFADILHSTDVRRVEQFSSMLESAKIVAKFKVPFILCSGALSQWDMRSPSDMLSFGRVLGFSDPQIKTALSGKIIGQNRKKLSGKWVSEGVELE